MTLSIRDTNLLATRPRGGTVGCGTALQARRSRVRFHMVPLDFFIDIKSFRSHCGPGSDSASNRYEYQEYFLQGKLK